MGALGSGPFENDDACDWLTELWEIPNITFIQRSLKLTLVDHLYLGAPKGSVLIAACEVVAEGLGKGSADLPRQAKNWVLRHPRLPYSDVAPLAIRAAKRVLGTRSELNALWNEDQKLHAAWKAGVLELVGRLST